MAVYNIKDLLKNLLDNDANSNNIVTTKEVNAEEAIDYAKFAIRLFICIAGICGNCLVIFVILVLKEYRKAVTHWYVLQLAIADSIFLLTLPFKMVEDIRHEWIYSSGMCKAKETILFLNYYASILFLMIMSIDRYVAVCHGFSDFLQKFRTHRAAYVITAVTWIISLILCAPVMLYSDKIGTAPRCICQYEFPKEQATLEDFCEKEGMMATKEDFDFCKSIYQEVIDNRLCKVENSTFSGEDYNSSNYYDYNYDETDYGEYSTGNYTDVVTKTKGNDSSYDGSNLDKLDAVPQIGIAPSCHYWDQGGAWKSFLIFNFVFMFLLPFLVMSTCYTLIVFKLQETNVKRRKSARTTTSVSSYTNRPTSSSVRKQSKSAATTRASSDRNRVTIMCGVLVFLFVACWLPFHSVHMAKIKGISLPRNQEKWCELLPMIASMIAYMNSALNPYLYNFLGTRFGRRFRTAMTSVRTTMKNSTSSVSSPSGVKYTRRRHRGSTGEYSSSQGVTLTTKIYKGNKSIINSEHHSATMHSTTLNEQKTNDHLLPMLPSKNEKDPSTPVCDEEHPLNTITNDPPPTYENVVTT